MCALDGIGIVGGTGNGGGVGAANADAPLKSADENGGIGAPANGAWCDGWCGKKLGCGGPANVG